MILSNQEFPLCKRISPVIDRQHFERSETFRSTHLLTNGTKNKIIIHTHPPLSIIHWDK